MTNWGGIATILLAGGSLVFSIFTYSRTAQRVQHKADMKEVHDIEKALEKSQKTIRWLEKFAPPKEGK